MKAVSLFCLIAAAFVLKAGYFAPDEDPEMTQVFAVPPAISVSVLEVAPDAERT